MLHASQLHAAGALLVMLAAFPAAAQRPAPASQSPFYIPPPVGADAAPAPERDAAKPAPGSVAPDARRGTWATLVLGRGDLAVGCDICRETDQAAFAGTLAMGGTLNPRVRLGGELTAWRKTGEDATQRVLGVGAVAQLYPSPRRNAFVRLGLSVLDYRVSDADQALTTQALALGAGFGWEIPVREIYRVVPFAQLLVGPSRGLSIDDARITSGATVRMLQFGLGVGVGR